MKAALLASALAGSLTVNPQVAVGGDALPDRFLTLRAAPKLLLRIREKRRRTQGSEVLGGLLYRGVARHARTTLMLSWASSSFSSSLQVSASSVATQPACCML